MKHINIGDTFGDLTVVRLLDERKNTQKVYECLCTCKKFTNVRSGHLKSGQSTTCGHCKSVLIDGFYWTPNKEGYYVRTVDDKVIRLHVYTYEKAHNIKVPKSHCIHHRDGNKENNDISNLQMMSNSEHKTVHNIDNTYGTGKHPMYGKKHSLETRKKMSESRKKFLDSKFVTCYG